MRYRAYIILAAAILIELLIGATLGWGAFVPLIIKYYGYSAVRSQMIFSVTIVVFSLSIFGYGRVIGRIGERVLLLGGSLLYILAYAMASLWGGSYPMLLLSIGVLASTGVSAIYLALLQLCVSEFCDRAGTVTGALVAGYGLGAFIIAYLIRLVAAQGYDIGQVFIGISLFYGLPVLLLNLLIVKLYRPACPVAAETTVTGRTGTDAYTAALMVAMMASTLSGYAILSNIALMVKSVGLPAVSVAPAIALFAVGNSGGRLVWGAVSDAVGAHRAIVLSFVLQAVLLFFLGNTTGYNPLLPVAVLVAGAGFGANLVLYPARIKEHYGVENLGGIYSVVFLATAVSGFAGPFLGGWAYEHFGNYLLAMRLIFLVLILGFIVYAASSRSGPDAG